MHIEQPSKSCKVSWIANKNAALQDIGLLRLTYDIVQGELLIVSYSNSEPIRALISILKWYCIFVVIAVEIGGEGFVSNDLSCSRALSIKA